MNDLGWRTIRFGAWCSQITPGFKFFGLTVAWHDAIAQQFPALPNPPVSSGVGSQMKQRGLKHWRVSSVRQDPFLLFTINNRPSLI